jgi:outer membrane lipoprotein carrier protein
MNKLKYFLFFVVLSALTPVFAETPSQQLEALLSNFHAMRADFTQVVEVHKSKPKESYGHMELQRPGKFRWEIISPNRQLIIADGKYLWIYDVDLAQATKQKLNQDANNPASLLSGSSVVLHDHFQVHDVKNINGSQVFQLKPKNRDMLENIELRFQDKKLQQMTVIDNLGQKSVFNFMNVVINPKLPSTLFRFHVPSHVDIIQNT